MSTKQLSDLLRRFEAMIKYGEVAEVKKGYVKVRHGKLLTTWLQYFVPFAGATTMHRQPSIGEKCIVLSPSGELTNGCVLTGLHSDLWPAPPGGEEETAIQFGDGTLSTYHHGSGQFSFTGSKNIIIEASEKILTKTPLAVFTGKAIIQQATNINGPLTYTAGMTGSGGEGGGSATISGNFKMTGSFTQTGGLMTSNGIVASEHGHAFGGNQVGKPT